MSAAQPQLSCLTCGKPVSNAETDDFCTDDCRRLFAEGFLDEFAPSTVAFRFWRQYVLLQERFMEIATHIDLSERNLETHSDALVEFIRSAGAEVDSICKTICPGNSDQRTTMDVWRSHLESTFELSRVSLLVPRSGSYVRPFRLFALNRSPAWWTAYNDVKHRRSTNFEKATLRVALEALSALFILNLIKMRDFFDHWRALGRVSPRPFDDGFFSDLERLFYVRGTGISRAEGVRSQLLEVAVVPRSRGGII